MTKMLTKTRTAATVWKSCAVRSKSRAPCAALWVLRPSPGSSAPRSSGLAAPPRAPRDPRAVSPSSQLPAHSLDRLPLLPSPPGDYIPPMLPLWGSSPPSRPSASLVRLRRAALRAPRGAVVPSSPWPPAPRPPWARLWVRPRPCWSGKGLPIPSGAAGPSGSVGSRARGPHRRRCRIINQMLSQQRALSAWLLGFSRGRSGDFGRGPDGQSGGRGSGRGGGHVESGAGFAGIKSTGQARLIPGVSLWHRADRDFGAADSPEGRQTPTRRF